MDTAASELNLGALLPSVGFVVGLIEFLLGLAVLAGPALLLGFGLLYKYNPPKEANYSLGYRFWWGMASLDSWTYTQALAGKVFTLMGAIMGGVMVVMCIVFLFLDTMAIAMIAALCLLVELIAVAVACITINVIVMRKFDKDGYARNETVE